MSNKNDLHGSEQSDKTWKLAALFRELSAWNFLVLRKSFYIAYEKKDIFPLFPPLKRAEG